MPTSDFSYSLIDVFNNYLLSLYPPLLNAIARFILAILVVFVGWLVSYLFKLVVEISIEKIKIHEWLEKLKLSQYFQGFEFEENISRIVGDAVFWLVFLVFFMSATDIVGLTAVSSFLRDLIYFIPKAVTGILIILAGFVFGELARRVMGGFLRGLEKRSADFLSSLTKFTIVVFATLTALNQWGVATEIINTLMFGLVIFFGLAGGLAFGLGGQEIARDILESLRKKLK